MPTSPTRVLLVSQPTTEGVAVCVRELAAAGRAAGFDVTVGCPEGGDLPGWLTERAVTWRRVPMQRLPSPTDLRAVARVRSLMRHADVVHLHSSKAGAVGRAALATMGRGRPAALFTPHAWSWLAGNRLAPVYQVIERVLAPATDVIVAVSEEERAIGLPVLGAAARRVRVIENGVDTTHFSPSGPRSHRDERPLLVCLGRLDHQKGQDIAIRALATMRTGAARLRLVGGGPQQEALVALAASLGLTDRVELTGQVDDPAPELRAADIVVVPSRWDGMSLGLLEAMACGATIVASAVPGSDAVAGAGVIVPQEDPRALGAAIDDLLAHPDRARELGAAAAARARDRFSLERSTGRTLDLWAELAARRIATK